MRSEEFAQVYRNLERAWLATQRLTALRQDHKGGVTRVAQHLAKYLSDPELVRAIEEIVAKRGNGPMYTEAIVRYTIELRIALDEIVTTHPTVDNDEELMDADILLEGAGIEKAVDLLPEDLYYDLVRGEYIEISGWWLTRRDRGD